ncbi:MAG: alanine racemase [Candidatus Gastranaerophilaceae bacterium]
MKFNRQSYINTKRDAWVEINLDAIEHNILELKKFVPDGTKVLAVIKADAYGHGSVPAAPTLIASGVDMFGVASVDEGMQLREAKITLPILVLGAAPVWTFARAAENNITLSVFTKEHIKACRQAFEETGIKPHVHVKLDTGMNRIGVGEEHAVELINEIRNSDFMVLDGIFTHFACAENRERTAKQLEVWYKTINNVDTTGLILHNANTAALISTERREDNMVRAGIGIYGLMPDLPEGTAKVPDLRPAMSLKARIVNIHEAPAGTGVSYSYRYTTDKPTKIATVPTGYADGVSRGLSGKIFGILKGKKVPQIGNITMDQMMFDITGIDASDGDVITLLGKDGDEEISINEWAKILNTINYELTCRLKVRLARVYTR